MSEVPLCALPKEAMSEQDLERRYTCMHATHCARRETLLPLRLLGIETRHAGVWALRAPKWMY